MKRLKLYISLFLFPCFVVAKPTLEAVINSYNEFFPEYEWLLNSSVRSSSLIKDFPINEKADTIYVKANESGGRLPFILIWKNDRVRHSIAIYSGGEDTIVVDGVVKYAKFSHVDVYQELIANWEPEVLKFIGEENYFPGIGTNHLMRVVVENGSMRNDTTTYWPYSSLQDIPKEQLDSIRQTCLLANSTNLIIRKNAYKNYYPYNIRPNAESAPDNSKSIWQRIAEWFIRLWHSIFG